VADPYTEPQPDPPPDPSTDGSAGTAGPTPVWHPADEPSLFDHLPTTHRYELGGELARGGMGIVYRATDTVLGREVAVKVLPTRFAAEPGLVARFVAEARVTGALQHPAVPAVHDLGRLPDGNPFLAMKLIEGRTLSALLEDRPDPVDRRRLVAEFEHICQAVGFAHSRGVIHRDLKPANVMVGAFGEVQVMDWGLAKEAPGPERETWSLTGDTTVPPSGSGSSFRVPGTEATQPGAVMGTPAYMPPEQARGELDRIDARSDVFALGGVLCAILTGKAPYAGTDVRSALELAARAELTDCLARLDAAGADPELVALAKRCLAPEREDRPADGGAVAAAIAAYREGVEARLKAAEADRAAAEARAAEEANTRREAEARADVERLHASEQRRKRRWQLAAVAAAGALLLGAGGTGWWLDRQAARRAAEAFDRQLIDERRSRDEQDRAARNREALAASLESGERALRQGDATAAGTALAEINRRQRDGVVSEFASRITRLRAEQRLLEEIDRIDTFRWTHDAGAYPARSAVAERWAKAFAAFGIVPGTTPTAEAGRRAADALARDRFLQALDLWLGYAPSRELAAILVAADPDEFRAAVRTAVRDQDVLALRIQATRPEALTQPTRFAVPLGTLGDIPAERRRVILQKAVVGSSGELTLLMSLAETYPRTRAGAVERVRWYQAAVAAHPRYAIAWNNLGDALILREDWSGATDALERAVELAPGLAVAHNNLGVALDRPGGDRVRAIAAYRAAVKANPKYGVAYHNLALALKDTNDLRGAAENFRAAIANGFRTGQAYNNLGVTLAILDDFDGAIAALEEGVRVAPKDTYIADTLKAVREEQTIRDRTAPPPREVKRP
jgi:Flp pilus assembly protein TadD